MKIETWQRLAAIIVAYFASWVIWFLSAVATNYDGFPSLILIPIQTTIASFLVVGVALLLGLLLRLPFVRTVWRSTTWCAVSLIVPGIFLLCFGYALGLRYVGTNPTTDRQVEILHPGVFVGAYFAIVFAIANWPIRRRTLTAAVPPVIPS